MISKIFVNGSLMKFIIVALIFTMTSTLIANEPEDPIFVDTDGDKVPDWEDYCPETPAGKYVWTAAQVAKVNGNPRWVGCAGGGVEDAKEGFELPSRDEVEKKYSRNREARVWDDQILWLGFERNDTHMVRDLPVGTRILFLSDLRDFNFLSDQWVFRQELGKATLKIYLPEDWLQIKRQTLCTTKSKPSSFSGDVVKFTCVTENEENIGQNIEFLFFSITSNKILNVGTLEKMIPIRVYIPLSENKPIDFSFRGIQPHLMGKYPERFYTNLATFFNSRKKAFLLATAVALKNLSLDSTEVNAPSAASRNYVAQLVSAEMIYPLVKETQSSYVQKSILPQYDRLLADYRKHVGVSTLNEIEVNKTNAEVIINISAQALRSSMMEETDAQRRAQMQAFLTALGVWSARLKAMSRIKDSEIEELRQLYTQQSDLISALSGGGDSAVFGSILAKALAYWESLGI